MEDSNKQKAIWHEHWENIDKGSPEQILYSRFSKEACHCLKNLIDGEADNLILEAGCGTGRLCCLLAKDLPNSKIIGVDISQNALDIGNSLKKFLRLPNISFEGGDIFSLRYPDEYFDVVFNEGVIEHFSLEDTLTYKDALREMIRVTKPGGKIIVHVPNWYCFPQTMHKWLLKKLGKPFEYGYEKSFRHRELISLFREFNLTNLRIKGYYPAHGFYRFGKYSRIFPLLGKMVDALDNKYIANVFGFMILIKGENL